LFALEIKFKLDLAVWEARSGLLNITKLFLIFSLLVKLWVMVSLLQQSFAPKK